MHNAMNIFLRVFYFQFEFCLYLFIFLIIFAKHELNSSKKINDVRNYDRSTLGEEKSHQHKNLKNDKKMFQNDNLDVNLDDESEISKTFIFINEDFILENVFFDSVRASFNTNLKRFQYGI